MPNDITTSWEFLLQPYLTNYEEKTNLSEIKPVRIFRDGVEKQDDQEEKTTLSEIKPVRIFRDGYVTTVIWNDNTSTKVKLCEDEYIMGIDSPYTAFCAAYAKKMFGTASAIRRMVKNCDDEVIKEREAEKARKRHEEDVARQEINHKKKIRRLAKRLRELDEAFEVLHAQTHKSAHEAKDKDGDKKAVPSMTAWPSDDEFFEALKSLKDLYR